MRRSAQPFPRRRVPRLVGALALAWLLAPDAGAADKEVGAPADAAEPSLAQAAPPPLPARRGGADQPLPPVSPTSAPNSTLTNPPALPPVPKLSDAPRFLLRDVVVEGNTVLDPAALDAVIAPYRGKQITVGDLDEMRRQLTVLYIKAGYINSGVVIPDQRATDGIIKFRVVEGRITNIAVSGTHWFKPGYFESRLQDALRVPFNVRDAETEQQILLQDPLVQRLNLELLPGTVPGEAHMRADVTEGPQYAVGLQVANDQSPTVGEVRGQIQGSVANLYGYGDVLSASYGHSDGLNDGSLQYSLPILADDTRVTVHYDRNGTLVVDPSLAPLNVTSDYSNVSLAVSRPFYRTPEQQFDLTLDLDWRRAQSFLLGVPFPFTAGADANGHTNVTALRFIQSWTDHDAVHALALRSTFSFGLNIFDATVEPAAAGTPTASGQFFSWLGQAQYVRRVFGDCEAVLRGDLQLADRPLFPIEQFALGGIDTVRGYREYLVVTDDALFASGELRIPFAKWKLPYFSGEGEDAGAVQFTPFYDYGRGWNVDRPTPNPQDISAAGVGLRWLIGSGTTAEIYYGKALRHVPVGTALEDRGIFFRLTAAAF